MKSEEIKSLFTQFEQASSELDGIECWSARELQPLLGYSKWENLEKVLAKAKEACKQVGEEPADHFPDVRKVIDAGKGAQHAIEDIALTRYGCYLVAQNGDSRKPEIAFAQTDFLPTISIKAKDLAAEMTSLNVQSKDSMGHNPIEKEHLDNSGAVRNMLLERGIVPESPPPAEDMKKAQRKSGGQDKRILKGAIK